MASVSTGDSLSKLSRKWKSTEIENLARTHFSEVLTPLLWMSTSLIWQSSEQRIDLQSIQHLNNSLVDNSPSPRQQQKLYIWVSFKVNFNFFGRLSAFATEWWMQGCTQKPSAPKVFTNFNSNFPFPSRKLWNYFQISNCKDALEMPSAPKVLTNSRKSQEAAADDLYQGSNNHQVQYRDDMDLHSEGWSIDHFSWETDKEMAFFINQQ